jgi:hypothetical protein
MYFFPEFLDCSFSGKSGDFTYLCNFLGRYGHSKKWKTQRTPRVPHCICKWTMPLRSQLQKAIKKFVGDAGWGVMHAASGIALFICACNFEFSACAIFLYWVSVWPPANLIGPPAELVGPLGAVDPNQKFYGHVEKTESTQTILKFL